VSYTNVGEGRATWQDVIDTVEVLRKWVEVMYWAAAHLNNIVGKPRLTAADRKNVATVVNEINQGLDRPKEIIDTLKRMNANQLSTKWKQIVLVWQAFDKTNPQNEKSKMGAFVQDINSLFPMIDEVTADLVRSRNSRNQAKPYWVAERGKAIAELRNNLIPELENALAMIHTNESAALAWIETVMTKINPVQEVFWMFGGNDFEMGSWLKGLIFICDKKKKWTTQTTLDCSKYIFNIKGLLPKLVANPQWMRDLAPTQG
jgi:hypothetical protein